MDLDSSDILGHPSVAPRTAACLPGMRALLKSSGRPGFCRGDGRRASDGQRRGMAAGEEGSSRKAPCWWFCGGEELSEGLLPSRDRECQSSRGVWAFQSSPEWDRG